MQRYTPRRRRSPVRSLAMLCDNDGSRFEADALLPPLLEELTQLVERRALEVGDAGIVEAIEDEQLEVGDAFAVFQGQEGAAIRQRNQRHPGHVLEQI